VSGANPDRYGRPANRDRIIGLNMGLGRDSLTMLTLAADCELYVKGVGRLCLEDLDYVVFSDTGREWPHTYKQIAKVRKLVKGRVPFLVLRKPKTLPKALRGAGGRKEPRRDLWPVDSWEDIVEKAKGGGYHYRLDIFEDYASRLTFPGFGGDCTSHHKIGPMRRLMNDVSRLRFGLQNNQWAGLVRQWKRKPHIVLVGLAADEHRRINTHNEIEATGHPQWTGERRAPVYVRALLPLVDMKITKKDEAKYLKRYGFQDVRKSGCYMCKYQPPEWWWALSVTAPAIFADIVKNERRAMRRNKNMNVTGARIGGKLLTLPEVVGRWRAANRRATVKAVLDKSYERETKAAKEAMRRQLTVLPSEEQITEAQLEDDALGALLSADKCGWVDPSEDLDFLEAVKRAEENPGLPAHPDNLLLVRVRPSARDRLRADYLYYLLLHQFGRGAFARLATGTAQQCIAARDVKRIPVQGGGTLGRLVSVRSGVNEADLRAGDVLLLRVGPNCGRPSRVVGLKPLTVQGNPVDQAKRRLLAF
jgi:hypothetical protein